VTQTVVILAAEMLY